MKKQTYASVWDALEDTPRSGRQHARARRIDNRRPALRRSKRRNPSQAAKHLGITQPRLNDLLRGRIEKFSLDVLVNMLARVGKQVSVKVKRAA